LLNRRRILAKTEPHGAKHRGVCCKTEPHGANIEAYSCKIEAYSCKTEPHDAPLTGTPAERMLGQRDSTPHPPRRHSPHRPRRPPHPRRHPPPRRRRAPARLELRPDRGRRRHRRDPPERPSLYPPRVALALGNPRTLRKHRRGGAALLGRRVHATVGSRAATRASAISSSTRSAPPSRPAGAHGADLALAARRAAPLALARQRRPRRDRLARHGVAAATAAAARQRRPRFATPTWGTTRTSMPATSSPSAAASAWRNRCGSSPPPAPGPGDSPPGAMEEGPRRTLIGVDRETLSCGTIRARVARPRQARPPGARRARPARAGDTFTVTVWTTAGPGFLPGAR